MRASTNIKFCPRGSGHPDQQVSASVHKRQPWGGRSQTTLFGGSLLLLTKAERNVLNIGLRTVSLFSGGRVDNGSCIACGRRPLRQIRESRTRGSESGDQRRKEAQ